MITTPRDRSPNLSKRRPEPVEGGNPRDRSLSLSKGNPRDRSLSLSKRRPEPVEGGKPHDRSKLLRSILAVALGVGLIGIGAAGTAVADGPPDTARTAKLIMARSGEGREAGRLSPNADRKTTKAAPAQPGDVTGDGLADAVVRDPGADSGTLRLFTHDGSTADNPWPESESLGGDWDFADPLLIGDVTGDDHPDLITRDAAGALAIHPWTAVAAGDNPWPDAIAAGTGWGRYDTLLLGDLTGDGRPDLIAREPGAASGTLWIIPHDGGPGNPYDSTPYWAGTGWNLADAMLLGDATGDGFPDVVVRDGGGSLWIYPHNGATSQNPFTSRTPAGTGWTVGQPLVLADATGDSRPDLIARSGDTMIIHPHSGATSGQVWSGTPIPAGTGWDFANAVIAGDLTGDGRPELLARVHHGDLWIYPNDGETPWADRFSAGDRWTFEDQLLLADVTGDGRVDVVARDPKAVNGTLWIYPGDGSADSDPWTAIRAFAGTGWNLATGMALGDLTGDGRPDLLIKDRGGELWVYPHNGGTGAANPWTVQRRWVGSGWGTARELRLADVDGDGRADLVDLENDGSLWVYPTGSSGSGSPAPIKITGNFADVAELAVGAVDGSDRPSLVTITGSGDVTVYAHATGAELWSSGRAATSGWDFASALLL
ncbi:FG-GAP-like repeat-containing protein [Microlunatus speluncae]|uniref:FG-GAP-like repeat-containing protein n=1 Tax=Microlunatus speluncae TaxID=2594267 RepID=UPI0012665A14|nr:FG-GAP-like repeat-containing protein [Microlunatus speluncae]